MEGIIALQGTDIYKENPVLDDIHGNRKLFVKET